MTTANWTKVTNQLANNPSKLKKFMKHSTPKKRSCGKVNSKCRLCGSTRGMITKYKLNVCRRCFRQFALKIGFRQYK